MWAIFTNYPPKLCKCVAKKSENFQWCFSASTVLNCFHVAL